MNLLRVATYNIHKGVQGLGPVRLAPREHLAYQWLPWREAADRCFSPSNAEAILQLPRFVPT